MAARVAQRSKADSAKKAALRDAVYELLPRILPVVREGGSIPLRSIAETIAGEKVTSRIGQALDGRGSITFAPGKAGRARFENVGKAMSLGLKTIKLKIPKRLSGWAESLDGDQGVALHFDKDHTLSACKMLVCADVEAVELTKKRIFVDLEGKAFDRTFDLGGQKGRQGAPAPGAPKKAPAAPKPGASKKVAAVPKKVPAVPKKEKAASEAKVAAREPRQPRKAPRTVVTASVRKEEQPAGRVKAALRGAVRDAKSNVRSGVSKTLRSAAESKVAATEAVHKAARDAKSNVRSGVRKTRESAAESRKATKEAARQAGASARGQFEHAGKTVRSRGRPARPQRGEPRSGGYLGMTTYPVRLPPKLADEHHATGGLLVLGVQPDGPADEAGLLLGDTLLTLGGRAVRKPVDLKTQLSPDHVGERMEAIVLRGGRTTHVTVEVRAR